MTIPPKKDSSSEERWDWFMRHLTQRMEKALYREACRRIQTSFDEFIFYLLNGGNLKNANRI